MVIGGAVSGGTAGRVLFEATGPVLADDVGLQYDTANGLTATTGAMVGRLAASGVAGEFTDGTRTVLICDGANHVSYTPGAAGNWSGSPTDVWAALDRIAAVVSLSGASPIP